MEPKTPVALKGERGMAWLFDVGDEKKFVETCPTEKLDVMGVKIREAVESMFIPNDNGEIVLEDDFGGADKAITVCNLIIHFAATENASVNKNLRETGEIIGASILLLHDHPEVTSSAGDALAALLDKGCVPPDSQVLTNLSLLAVYLAGTPNVTSQDVARLRTIRRFLSKIGWGDPRASEFVSHVKQLINPKFLQIEGSADVMVTLFSQSASLSRTLHKAFIVKTLRACRFKETARFAYINCMVKVWEQLDGIHGAVFEQEVIKEYVTLGVNADTKHFHQVREALLKLREIAHLGNNNKSKEGLKRLMQESDILSNLDVPNAVLRSNGISLLGDHFPIGIVTGKAAVGKLIVEQLQLLFRAIHDPVSLVRANAVTSICKVLKAHWNEIPKATALPCLDAIFSKMAFDKADHAVRLAALKSIRTELLTTPLMQEILTKLVCKLRHLDDPNARVRQAYTQILLDLSENPTFPVAGVASDEDLIRRLSVEKKKFVMTNLIKLVKNNLWSFDDVNHPSTEELKVAVKKLLVVATKYACAAVNIYRHLARQPQLKPQLFITLVRGVLQWVCGATTVKNVKQVEHILAVVSAVIIEVRDRIIGKTRHMKTLASHIETTSLNTIENLYDSSIVKQLLTHIRAVVSMCGGDSPNATAEKRSLMSLLQEAPSDRLLISKCISAGLSSEMLAFCAQKLSTGPEGIFIATEMLHNSQASSTILSDSRWSELREAVSENIKQQVSKIRSDPTSMSDTEIVNFGAQIELLGRLALHSACKKEANITKQNRILKRQKKIQETQPSADEDLRVVAKLMVDTLLSTAKKIRSKSALLAVTMAEQVSVFITQGITCGLLVKRLTVTPEADHINGPGVVRTLLGIDPHLMPCVLVLICRSLEMHVSHMLFDNWMDLLMSVFRSAASQIDELGVVPKGAPFADAEDLKTRVWSHFADHGIHPKHLDILASTIVRCNPSEVVRDFTENLWCYCLTVGGYSVAPFLLTEFCKHKAFNNVLIDILTNSLSRKSASGNILDPLESTSIAMIFATLLACKNRLLTARLASYYDTQLLPFFKKHQMMTGPRQRGDLETELFAEMEPTKCEMIQLGEDLATLDWTVPIPVSSQKPTCPKSQEKKQDKVTSRIESKRKLGEALAVQLDEQDSTAMDLDAVVGAVAVEQAVASDDDDQPPSLVGVNATPCSSYAKTPSQPAERKKRTKKPPTKTPKPAAKKETAKAKKAKEPKSDTQKAKTPKATKKSDKETAAKEKAEKKKPNKKEVAESASEEKASTRKLKSSGTTRRRVKPAVSSEEIEKSETMPPPEAPSTSQSMRRIVKAAVSSEETKKSEMPPPEVPTSEPTRRRAKPVVSEETKRSAMPPPRLNLQQMLADDDLSFEFPVIPDEEEEPVPQKVPLARALREQSVTSQSTRSKNELFLENATKTPSSSKSKKDLIFSTLFEDDEDDDDDDDNPYKAMAATVHLTPRSAALSSNADGEWLYNLDALDIQMKQREKHRTNRLQTAANRATTTT
eukprot:TRINITY_DN2684_c4_g3_i1.p1 TRINITY_DN2684_c4_g3~~TRINITY_DN2684_c4_g3_i1.p1  ORF type:complete len:1530 (+),score=310.26 TRINITY_DN2684_c4_g3_i1:62-4591(+)